MGPQSRSCLHCAHPKDEEHQPIGLQIPQATRSPSGQGRVRCGVPDGPGWIRPACRRGPMKGASPGGSPRVRVGLRMSAIVPFCVAVSRTADSSISCRGRFYNLELQWFLVAIPERGGHFTLLVPRAIRASAGAGRDELISKLEERIPGRRVTALLGPRLFGKASVLRRVASGLSEVNSGTQAFRGDAGTATKSVR
jgi:hypothetical protein